MANVTRILAFALIGVAVLLGIFALSLSRRAPLPAPPVAQGPANFVVVVAARDLPAGKPIEADALALRQMPARGANEFGDATGLAGRVPLETIAANTPLSGTSLATGLADAIAPGERAVAVRVDEGNAVGNRVRPGNFVDVFFMLKRDGQGGTNTGAEVEDTQARLLLSRVRVLSFGDATLPGTSDSADTAAAAAAAAAANAPRNLGARTAILAVRTTDVDALTLAEGVGRLVLALRNASDRDVTEPSAVTPLLASLRNPNDSATQAAAGLTLQTLAGGVRAKAPRTPAPVTAASPPSPRAKVASAPRVRTVSDQLEVIRGAHSEKVAY